MKRLIGTWQLPSGNSCDVSCEQDDAGGWPIWFEWDSPPPFSPSDEHHYTTVVIPEVIGKMRLIIDGGSYGNTIYIRIT